MVTKLDLKADEQAVLRKIYKDNYEKVKRHVLQNSGTEDDAKDVFQDSAMILLEKIRKDDFELSASINTYLFAISKNLWLKKLRDRKYYLPVDHIDRSAFFEEIDSLMEKEPSIFDKLRHYMSRITDHCNRLIHDLFFRKKNTEDIQKDYGYTTKHNLHNQKHKCIEQIRKAKKAEENKL